jgi:hypothetical protein
MVHLITLRKDICTTLNFLHKLFHTTTAVTTNITLIPLHLLGATLHPAPLNPTMQLTLCLTNKCDTIIILYKDPHNSSVITIINNLIKQPPLLLITCTNNNTTTLATSDPTAITTTTI